MVRSARKLICAFLLIATPVAADGPMAVVSSVTSDSGKVTHLDLVATRSSILKDAVSFKGFLAKPTNDRPQPFEVVVSRDTRDLLQRTGANWRLQTNPGEIRLTVVQAGEKDRGLYRFFGKTSSGEFSVGVTDDPTGVEEAVLIIAGAALLICGTVYIYDDFRRDCAKDAEAACGKRGVKSIGQPSFGISIDKKGFHLGCKASCPIECNSGS